MLEEFLKLVDPSIHHRSGSVLYSGRAAFEGQSQVYILGLNPGGCPVAQAKETVARDIADALTVNPYEWSAYADESWKGRRPGTHGMQPRILHLLGRLGLDPRRVPASNVAFVRSAREADLGREKADLLKACWPMHQAVIDKLGVRVVLCLGGTAGAWVRDAIGANEQIDSFTEANERRWTSVAHRNASGLHVVTLTHPSIAAWTVDATDPTPLVRRVLDLCS